MRGCRECLIASTPWFSSLVGPVALEKQVGESGSNRRQDAGERSSRRSSIQADGGGPCEVSSATNNRSARGCGCNGGRPRHKPGNSDEAPVAVECRGSQAGYRCRVRQEQTSERVCASRAAAEVALGEDAGDGRKRLIGPIDGSRCGNKRGIGCREVADVANNERCALPL